MLDFDTIAKKCNLFDETDVEAVINNIASLDEQYSKEDLVEIYNYILTVCKNPDILMNTIRFADRFRFKSTLNVLIDLLLLRTESDNVSLQEKYVNVRSMCAKAIANYRDTEAVTPLLYCLNNKDEHYRVRLACADALGKIGDKYAVAPLIEVVKDESEKSVYLRESAASALGLIGDLRAIDPLVSILETKQGLMNKFTFLKERVIEALAKLRLDDNDRVFHALKSSLDDESTQVRINAIEALMESTHPEAAGAIKTCLSDNDEEVRKNALIALYNIVGRDILDEVISLPSYEKSLKEEAQALIEEYEND